MSKTTIQLSDSTKEKLRDARLEHETNYGQTIERLLGESATSYPTEGEVRDIVREEVIAEALE